MRVRVRVRVGVERAEVTAVEASARVIEPRLWVEEVARVVTMEKEAAAVGHAVERAEEESEGSRVVGIAVELTWPLCG